MDTATLLADPAAIRPACIRPSPGAITLVVTTTALRSECPRCHRRSSRVHSRYTRRVADLPWHNVPVKLELRARRFRCRNSFCTRRIFCERLPPVVAQYARKTVRLNAALGLIGFALGVEAGARLARELGLTVSPDSLLRRLRQASQIESTAPRFIGADDFAFRRGQRCGTLLVDLERRRPTELLPDREAETLGAWLKAHPGIEIVTGDRSKTYASGIAGGAPAAVQIADRQLCRLFPQIGRAKESAQTFTRMVRGRTSTEFNEWLGSAARSKLQEFTSFARGLSEDYMAVKNALRYEWSNGRLEGQVNRLKLIKRTMYGRAKFDLLRARVLHST